MSIWISATSTGDKRGKVTLSDGTEQIIEPGASATFFVEGDFEVQGIKELPAEPGEGAGEPEG